MHALNDEADLGLQGCLPLLLSFSKAFLGPPACSDKRFWNILQTQRCHSLARKRSVPVLGFLEARLYGQTCTAAPVLVRYSRCSVGALSIICVVLCCGQHGLLMSMCFS